MKYVTSDEMRRLDRDAIEKNGIPAVQLMENAGRAVADEVAAMCEEAQVFIFCGYGNNGGDGFVAARHLVKRGYKVRVFLVGKPKPLSPEAKANFDSMRAVRCIPKTIENEREIIKIFATSLPPDIVVDAIFGIGIRDSLDSFYSRLIDEINSIGVPVIAVDVPSGLDSDTGEARPCAVRAYKTVTFGFPKKGFENPEAAIYLGEVVVSDIFSKKVPGTSS